MLAQVGALDKFLGNKRPCHRDSADVLEIRNGKTQVARAASVISGKEEGRKVCSISAESAGVLVEGVHRDDAMEAFQLLVLLMASNIRLR